MINIQSVANFLNYILLLLYENSSNIISDIFVAELLNCFAQYNKTFKRNIQWEKAICHNSASFHVINVIHKPTSEVKKTDTIPNIRSS